MESALHCSPQMRTVALVCFWFATGLVVDMSFPCGVEESEHVEVTSELSLVAFFKAPWSPFLFGTEITF